MEYKLIKAFESVGSSFYDVLLVEDIYTKQPVILKPDYSDKEIGIMERLKDLSFVPKFIRKDSSSKAAKNIYTAMDDMLIMEYMPGNDLADLIEDDLKLEEEDVLECLAQLPLMFKQIFEKGVIHGDINWHNIRISDKLDVYIIDFDESIVVDDTSKLLKDVIKGIIKLYSCINSDSMLESEKIKQLADIDLDKINSYEELDIIVKSICSAKWKRGHIVTI